VQGSTLPHEGGIAIEILSRVEISSLAIDFKFSMCPLRGDLIADRGGVQYVRTS